MAVLFISDLHLSQKHPQTTGLFLQFMQQQASSAEALYILGDLFEYWLGDDMILPEYEPVLAEMQKLNKHGVPVYVMYGNRDFLMREGFEERSGSQIIHEPHFIDVAGNYTLLLHGDTLCTDDIEYQKFRTMVRNPDWQNQALAKPPQERLALAKQLRDISQSETSQKAADIMDVNQQTVVQTMKELGVKHLIHGHTHRPAIHDFDIDGEPAQRIVLGDWYTSGSVLICDNNQCRLEVLD